MKKEGKSVDYYEISDKIAKLVESNDAEGVWNICSTQFKSETDKKHVEETVNKIYRLLQDSKVYKVDQARVKRKYEELWIKEKRPVVERYELLPYYFKEYSTKLSDRPLGYEFNITLSFNQIEKWRLENIDYIDRYVTADYEMKNYIQAFISDLDTVKYSYKIVNNGKIWSNEGMIKTSALSFKDELSDLTYLPQYTYRIPSDSLNFMSLKLMKDMKNDKYDDLDAFVKEMKKARKYNLSKRDIPGIVSLEFIFYDVGQDFTMVSSGKGYAFFKTKGVSKIKDFILNQLHAIK